MQLLPESRVAGVPGEGQNGNSSLLFGQSSLSTPPFWTIPSTHKHTEARRHQGKMSSLSLPKKLPENKTIFPHTRISFWSKWECSLSPRKRITETLILPASSGYILILLSYSQQASTSSDPTPGHGQRGDWPVGIYTALLGTDVCVLSVCVCKSAPLGHTFDFVPSLILSGRVHKCHR